MMPTRTAADDNFYDILLYFRSKYDLILHVNRLLADDSHAISSHMRFLRVETKFESVVCCNV